jgi:LPXTG-motif cell wall-anchored protein
MFRRSGVLAIFLAIIALFTFQVSAAVAGGKGDDGRSVQQADHEASDHDGDADPDSSTSYNEDNDTNDNGTANNVADDGDNAHPSGKDRSVENGKSGNQGNSESDPDDDGHGPDRSNGGPDKPNGTGGVDKADQDGNNGCGNDDDFEDDNEGWCGHQPKPGDEVEGDTDEVCTDDSTMGTHETCGDEVEGDTDEVCEKDDTMAAGDTEICGAGEVEDDTTVCEKVMASGDTECGKDDSVLGEVLNRATTNSAPTTVGAAGEVAGAPATLPFTGAELIPFAAAGLGMVGAGAAMARRRKR